MHKANNLAVVYIGRASCTRYYAPTYWNIDIAQMYVEWNTEILTISINTIFILLLLPQWEEIPRIWQGEQGIQCFSPPRPHHGNSHCQVHEGPYGRWWGCLQEAVLSLHQVWHHCWWGKGELFVFIYSVCGGVVFCVGVSVHTLLLFPSPIIITHVLMHFYFHRLKSSTRRPMPTSVPIPLLCPRRQKRQVLLIFF